MESLFNDEYYIDLFRSGDLRGYEYLHIKYTSRIKFIAKKYYCNGMEVEDFIQEGYLGLLNAIKDYKPSHGITFSSFATVCIERHIITALKTATRQKHRPLNSGLSMDGLVCDTADDTTWHQFIQDRKTVTPEQAIVDKEDIRFIEAYRDKVLTDLEKEIYKYVIEKRLSYKEVEALTGISIKSIDNAIQRIRSKFKNYEKAV